MEYGLRYLSTPGGDRVLLTFPGESVPIVVPTPAPSAPLPVPHGSQKRAA